MKEIIYSWGRYRPSSSEVYRLTGCFGIEPLVSLKNVLPRGRGRSYGDCCLNNGGTLLDTCWLDRFIEFNAESGILKCESGVTLQQILDLVVPHGWFLEVTPGTKWVTVGGAIANDVHGKNHHIAGTFGTSILSLELLRSNGELLTCSPTSKQEIFSATIAGLGLTGLILTVTLKLKRIPSAFIECENHLFRNLEQYLELSTELSKRFHYTVAWIDCANKGSKFSRGILICGNHAVPEKKFSDQSKKPLVVVPNKIPSFVLSNFAARKFNDLFYFMKARKRAAFLSHYDPFFYPLDGVTNWNHLYGKNGFFQFQCVVPFYKDASLLRQVLELVRKSPLSSYLAVIKDFGAKGSPGIMSFPRPGHTICLDIPNSGEESFRLLTDLNRLAIELGGAIYPAKDATMKPCQFQASFPRLREFAGFCDPHFSSDMWRRVTDGLGLAEEQICRI